MSQFKNVFCEHIFNSNIDTWAPCYASGREIRSKVAAMFFWGMAVMGHGFDARPDPHKQTNKQAYNLRIGLPTGGYNLWIGLLRSLRSLPEDNLLIGLLRSLRSLPEDKQI